MIGLDTNILARFIVRDDEIQARQADAFFAEAESQQLRTHLSLLVVMELFWLLSFRYGYKKPALQKVLHMLLLHKLIVIEDEELVAKAYELYSHSKADFSDILIGLKNRQAGCQTTITFDKNAARLKEFSLLI